MKLTNVHSQDAGSTVKYYCNETMHAELRTFFATTTTPTAESIDPVRLNIEAYIDQISVYNPQATILRGKVREIIMNYSYPEDICNQLLQEYGLLEVDSSALYIRPERYPRGQIISEYFLTISFCITLSITRPCASKVKFINVTQDCLFRYSE